MVDLAAIGRRLGLPGRLSHVLDRRPDRNYSST